VTKKEKRRQEKTRVEKRRGRMRGECSKINMERKRRERETMKERGTYVIA
jgi:hypothetical protein